MNISRYIGFSGVILGLVLLTHGAANLTDTTRSISYKALALPGSPYGEMIGLALQDPVHLLWHGGTGHQHVGRKGEECSVCGVDHSKEGVVAGRHPDVEKNPVVRRKKWLLDLGASIRQNNNPRGHSGVVVDYEHQRVRDLVKLAYEMDPTNYGNYMMYSHFMLTHAIPSGLATMDDFYSMSEDTIAHCAGREEDPEDALTAAAAAEHILIYRTHKIDRADFWKFEGEYQRLAKELARYELNLTRAEQEGRLKAYEEEKMEEIKTRYLGFRYILKNYGRLIAESKEKRESGL